MSAPEISHRCFGGSGPLSVYWHQGPYGVAQEARKGTGVGWFAPNGALLGVEFDDVDEKNDRQSLSFPQGITVAVAVVDGRIAVKKTRKRLLAA